MLFTRLLSFEWLYDALRTGLRRTFRPLLLMSAITLGWVTWIEIYARPRGWVALLQTTIPEPLIYSSVPLSSMTLGAVGWVGGFVAQQLTAKSKWVGSFNPETSSPASSNHPLDANRGAIEPYTIICDAPALYIGEHAFEALLSPSEKPSDIYSPWVSDAAWATCRHQELTSAQTQLAHIKAMLIEALTTDQTYYQEREVPSTHHTDVSWLKEIDRLASTPQHLADQRHSPEKTVWLISGISEYAHPVQATVYVPWLVHWPIYNKLAVADSSIPRHTLTVEQLDPDQSLPDYLATQADRCAGLAWSIVQDDSQPKSSATLVQWYRNERCVPLLDRSMNIDRKLNGIGALSTPVLLAASIGMWRHLNLPVNDSDTASGQSMLGVLHDVRGSLCWEWHPS